MKPGPFTLFVVTLSLLFALVSCQAAEDVVGTPAEAPAPAELTEDAVDTPTEVAEAATPVEVTENFYSWYFDYIGEPGTEEMRNPLADRAYRGSPYLTAAYVDKVDTILTSFDQGGYDPFLQAQDIPQSFTVEEDFTAESEACVIVHEQWPGSSPHDLTIDLVKEGVWKINNIRPGNPRTPEGVTRLFYDWYIDYARNEGNPLVDEAYKTSAHLSSDFIARVEETLAGFEGGGYDPIMLAQDIPVNIFVESPVIDGDQASVVVQRYWGGNPQPSPMVVHLRPENGRWLIDDVAPLETSETGAEAPQPAAPTADMDPVAVTQAFYDWYLAYIGDRSSGDFRNPLVDKAYRGNPLLSEAFVTRVDELLNSSDQGGYDPFLLAQDIPNDVMAQSAMITGSQARVTVLRFWRPPEMDAIFAHLRQIDGLWMIDDVTSLELYGPTTATPEGTVQMFYAWYTDAVRRRFEDDTVDADFHNSDLLTESFKQHLDEMRAAAEDEDPEMGLHYDPLLCAQDVPYHVTPDQALINGQSAALTARSSFANQIIAIDLQSMEAGWLISNVTCVFTPEASAKAFYTWYLGYIGDRGDGDFRNPLAERAYRGHPLLSEAFVQQVDGMFDAEGRIGHDPFLLAQEVPATFSVDPGPSENTAVVHLHFGPDLVRHLLLTFTGDYKPRIDSIEEAAPLN